MISTQDSATLKLLRTKNQNCKCRGKPAEFVMPFRPMPQRNKCAEPHKTPQRTNKSCEHRRHLKFRRDAGNDGDERVDGDVGERIRQPRHFQKRFCFWRRRLMRFRWQSVLRFVQSLRARFPSRGVATKTREPIAAAQLSAADAKIILNPNFSMSVPPMKNADAFVTAQTTL